MVLIKSVALVLGGSDRRGEVWCRSDNWYVIFFRQLKRGLENTTLPYTDSLQCMMV